MIKFLQIRTSKIKKKDNPMPTPDHLLASNSEKLTLSTQGEITDWLNMEAIGNSAHAAAYLEALRNVTKEVTENGGFADSVLSADQARIAEDALVTYTGMLARRSEDNFQKQQSRPDGDFIEEIEGITPFREVSDMDIMVTSTEVNPDHPNFKNYQDSNMMLIIHKKIEAEARAALERDGFETDS